jgi:hypothetical protein
MYTSVQPQAQVARWSQAVSPLGGGPSPSPDLIVHFQPEDGDVTTEALQAMREALRTQIATHWTAGFLRLFQNDYHPQFNSVIGDFDECDFTGYAEIEAAGAPISGIDAETGQLVVAWNDPTTFAEGAVAGPQTAYGWYIANTAGTSVMAAGRFDTPVVFDENGDTFSCPVPRARILLALTH